MTRGDRRLIPNSLRYHRLKLRYEQTEVARLLGLSSLARVSDWETGKTMPSVENLFGLSIVYRTLPDMLFADVREGIVKDIQGRMAALETVRIQDG
jgi:transcriptional regulator with XRE-family HTH domain